MLNIDLYIWIFLGRGNLRQNEPYERRPVTPGEALSNRGPRIWRYRPRVVDSGGAVAERAPARISQEAYARTKDQTFVIFSLSVVAGDDRVTASTERIKPSNPTRFAQVRSRANHPFALRRLTQYVEERRWVAVGRQLRHLRSGCLSAVDRPASLARCESATHVIGGDHQRGRSAVKFALDL